jgi:hypothetical protein
MKRTFLLTISLCALLLPSLAVGAFAQAPMKPNKTAVKAATAITADQLKEYLYFVADDAMQGRDTPSPGLDATANFIAFHLKRWGFKPAGDNGSYLQKFALLSEPLDLAKTELKVGDQSYKLNEDFFRISGAGSATGAGMVFGGNGWMVKSKNYDALAGVDAKGKIVVLYSDGFPAGSGRLTQLPKGVTQADLTGTRGVDWANPVVNAKNKGASAVILVASPQLMAAWEGVRGFFARGGMYPEKLREQPAAGSELPPVFLVSEKVGQEIFAGESADKTSPGAFAINKTATAAAAIKSERKWTQNVVAVWEGSDPVLKNEMVAIGAHYDHVGVNPNAPGPDKIFNGADDDGSGTVAVLAMAEALAKSKVRPKRSVLFVWHAGEEKGLWGSEYYNKFPTVDIKKVVTALNIDMIGRSKKPGDTNEKNKELSGENEIYVIGSEMMSSTLGAITKGANAGYLNLKYDYRYDDPKDPNRFFFRSDHFNYALNGIPVVFWFDGEHEDYHQASDHPDKIDYTKMEKVTRTIFMTMWAVTDLKERPKVDKQLPPELSQR